METVLSLQLPTKSKTLSKEKVKRNEYPPPNKTEQTIPKLFLGICHMSSQGTWVQSVRPCPMGHPDAHRHEAKRLGWACHLICTTLHMGN